MKKMLCTLLILCTFLAWSAAGIAEGYTYQEPVKSLKLPRATPEEKGVSSEYILRTINAMEDQGIEIHSLVIAVDDEVIFDGYYYPYGPEHPHIMFSLTKLFTNAAVGVAVTDGQLALDDYVVDAFPEMVPEDASDNLKAMQLKHLITMTNGHGRMISGSELRPMTTSWLEHLMKEPVEYEPGTYYLYNSGSSVLASGMVTQATGMTCEEVLLKTGFGDLGMEHFSWDVGPDGINAGHGGVKITTEDILKVGVLYMNLGQWNGKQILSEEWCRYAIGLDKILEDQGTYAFHWTDMEDGAYTAGGSYGQTLCIVPALNMTIAVTAGTSESDALYRTLADNLIAPTLADGEDRQYEATHAEALKHRGATLNLLENPVETASPIAEAIDGKVFTAEENEDGVLTITLDVTDDYIDYTMEDHRGVHTIRNGVGQWIETETSMTSNYTHHQYQYPVEPIVAYAEWQDADTLRLSWRWPELAFVDTVELTFADDGETLEMVRSVNVNSGPLERPAITLR